LRGSRHHDSVLQGYQSRDTEDRHASPLEGPVDVYPNKSNMTQYEERRKCASAGNWVWKRCCVGIILSVWTFTAACTTLESAGRPVYEDPDTLVRLESIRRILSLPDVGLTHPVSLTQAQIKSLLASISARTKIGLLGSFKGTPGVPRLFD